MLILASQSPRRKELLTQLGYSFTCQPADIDETPMPDEPPEFYVARLAREKAQTIANTNANMVVLGSDTIVALNGDLLGKPIDFDDYQKMMRRLSGSQHQVHTGVAIVQDHQVETIVVSTEVTFKRLTEQDIENYWLTGEPQDKAGSYGLQGIGGQFVVTINGSYSAVVGLPLYETAELLKKFNVDSALTTNQPKAKA